MTHKNIRWKIIMFKTIAILTTLLLAITKVQASSGYAEERVGDDSYKYSYRLVTVGRPEQSLEIVNHTTGGRCIVPSRPDEVILRTLDNIFRFTQYHNFAGPYNAIEVLTDQRFAAIDLGANRYSLSQAYIENNRLFLRMRDHSVYLYDESNSALLIADD